MFLFFNLYLIVMLDSLSCSFTSIFFLTKWLEIHPKISCKTAILLAPTFILKFLIMIILVIILNELTAESNFKVKVEGAQVWNIQSWTNSEYILKHLFVGDIDFTFFFSLDFSFAFWNCSDSLIFFVFHFVSYMYIIWSVTCGFHH